jgi:hypothetical protein
LYLKSSKLDILPKSDVRFVPFKNWVVFALKNVQPSLWFFEIFIVQFVVLVNIVKFKMASDARKNWETANKIENVDGDQLYHYDSQKYNNSLSARPWTKEYFIC